jgi:hypothetical protein
MSFKLQIVQEIERGQLTVTDKDLVFKIEQLLLMVRKFGNFDWENQTPFTMSPEQKIMELEAKVKLLEKQKSFGTTSLCCR